MKILFIGDIVAKPGRKAVGEILPKLIKEKDIDLTIANVENLSHGKGITKETIEEIRSYGVNIMTSGNHIWYREEAKEILDSDPSIIRPANYPSDLSGFGFTIAKVEKDKVLVINLLGRQWLDQPVEDAFRSVDAILADQSKTRFASIIVDFHAEATSEKMAMGWYLDGRVTATIGTHTHVPTADAFIMPKGSAYITDVGMTGATHSVLGVESDIIIRTHKFPDPQRFEWVENGPAAFRSVLIETGRALAAKSIIRLDQELEF